MHDEVHDRAGPSLVILAGQSDSFLGKNAARGEAISRGVAVRYLAFRGLFAVP